MINFSDVDLIFSFHQPKKNLKKLVKNRIFVRDKINKKLENSTKLFIISFKLIRIIALVEIYLQSTRKSYYFFTKLYLTILTKIFVMYEETWNNLND